MNDWQQRVIDEADALRVKCVALDKFLDTEIFDTLPLEEQAKLAAQAWFMSMYLMVLTERINSFDTTEEKTD